MRVVLTVLSLVLAVGVVDADPITFTFTARLDSVDTSFFPGAAVGDIVSGSYSFDHPLPFTPGPPTTLSGFYEDSDGVFTLHAGSSPLVIPGVFVFVECGTCDPDLEQRDTYEAGAIRDSDQLLVGIALVSLDPVLGGLDLPLTPPDLSKFLVKQLVGATPTGTTEAIKGTILSLTSDATAVSEPATLVLMLSGLASIIAIARRRTRD